MKLSEYIFNRLINEARSGIAANRPPTEEDIERWIVEWYGNTFRQANLGGRRIERETSLTSIVACELATSYKTVARTGSVWS